MFGDAGSLKLSLIGLYDSQFREPPRSLAAFTPATAASAPAHEAVWSEATEGLPV
jgi:hypothetical protein